MTTAALWVLVGGSILTIGGVALVTYREFASSGRRRLVSRPRDLVEVAAPALGVLFLLVVTWRAVR